MNPQKSWDWDCLYDRYQLVFIFPLIEGTSLWDFRMALPISTAFLSTQATVFAGIGVPTQVNNTNLPEGSKKASHTCAPVLKWESNLVSFLSKAMLPNSRMPDCDATDWDVPCLSMRDIRKTCSWPRLFYAGRMYQHLPTRTKPLSAEKNKHLQFLPQRCWIAYFSS